MTRLLYTLFLLSASLAAEAQSGCTFKPPFLTIHFGKGDVPDLNQQGLSQYARVDYDCPSDGYYTYVSYTTRCFSDDWHTMEDHTPGAGGNMLLVNSADRPSAFLRTSVKGFKPGTTYELGLWLINVCKPSDKCPYPLLPNLTILIQTESGRTVARINTGEIPRVGTPRWTQHRAVFTTPADATAFRISMTNNNPGGCGNDFALDDITFRECVVTPQVVKAPAKVVEEKKQPPAVVKKETLPPVKKDVKAPPATPAVRTEPQPQRKPAAEVKSTPIERKPVVLPAPPPALTRRENTLVKTLEAAAGEIRLDLYDNGEIDGDTVSIYHNNQLIVSRARLSQRPISFKVALNNASPHHELVMVAENLGSIPPNTSLMIVTAGDKRYQVFITSTEQKNAKVVLELKE